MSEDIGVLAVLRGAIDPANEFHRQAVDAVKELVEADRAYDAARDRFAEAWSPEAMEQAAEDLANASKRRAAAFARFGGES